MRKILVILLVLAFVGHGDDAEAQKRRRRRGKRNRPAPAKVEKARPAEVQADVDEREEGGKKVQVFDFTGLTVEGKMRTPQLLYFLGRVKEELEQASLEKRTFMPELVRSVEEGGI